MLHPVDVKERSHLYRMMFPDSNTNAAANNIGLYTRQGYLIRNPNPIGSCQCAIPMRHIFGFVDDYSKVTYGMQDALEFICKDVNDALFRNVAAGAGKVLSRGQYRLFNQTMYVK